MNEEKVTLFVADKKSPERDVLAAVLQKLGYDVRTTDSAEELERLLESDLPFTVVIVRSRLLGGGEAATEWARSKGRPNRRVILISDEVPGGGMVGFVDLTENALLALGVRLPEIVFATNDLVFSRKGVYRRKKRIYGGFGASFLENDTWHKGGLYNLSTDGAFIETLKPPGVGTQMKLRFSLPGESQEIELDCRVTWRVGPDETKGRKSPPGVGVQFLDVPSHVRTTIEEFVKTGGQR